MTPYLGDGEFYLEYGDFDVELSVPTGWLVEGRSILLTMDGEVARVVIDPAFEFPDVDRSNNEWRRREP
jgi:hypothetical protein